MTQTNTKSILITGGCGFIGLNLIRLLLDQTGFRIRVLDNFSLGNQSLVNSILAQYSSESVEIIEGDILNREDVRRACDAIDMVIHLAGSTSVAYSVSHPLASIEHNTIGTLNVLEGCREMGVPTMVMASSNAVLGDQDMPVDETNLPRPKSVYGAGKLAGEALCWAYSSSYGVRTRILRFSNVYGPFSGHKMSVVMTFMRNLRSELLLAIYGDGHQTRDFIYVSDLCQAIVSAMQYEPDRSGVDLEQDCLLFHIATGVETEIAVLAETLNRMAEKSGFKVHPLAYKSARTGDISRNYSSITAARDTLGWEPKVRIHDGLQRTWTWFLNQSEGETR